MTEPELKAAEDGLKYMSELIKGSKELDPHVPKGMGQFMSSIFDKSKKLAFPGLLFAAGAAATVAAVATGGAAASVLGICSGSIGLLNTMRNIYKINKTIKADNKAKKGSQVNDDQLNTVIGGLSEEISSKIELLETSIQSNLGHINLSLKEIMNKLDKIIYQHDKNIEAAFRDIKGKMEDKRYTSASAYLNNWNLHEFQLQSNVGIEKECFKSIFVQLII